ncbi:MAG: hypothetical protein KDA79_13215 [Planctomycetaceae bacterium]|nr:hypothetical protein [Planctomycetaceae bacterium]
MSDLRYSFSDSALMGWLLAGCGLLAGLVTSVAWLAIRLVEQLGWDPGWVRLPAFGLSTGLLFCCSLQLAQAQGAVNREKQQLFRSCLSRALGCSAGFMTMQAVGLWCLIQLQQSEHVATGSLGLVIVFTALHALHVSVAVLCLLFVTLQARRNRYDHEYSWGVTFCGWFWHALGAVWAAILVAMLIAT